MAYHILVVEDDRFLLETYQWLLESEGYHVSLSMTTFEDITEVERLHPDLVLLDVKISDKEDGLSMLEHLRTYPPTSSLPVILCTAAFDMTTRERVETIRQQSVPVIYKPFEVNNLLATIRTALGIDGQEEVLLLPV